MQNAITTKYLTATATRGTRIQARVAHHRQGGQKVTLPYNHALSVQQNHLAAAMELHLQMQQLNMMPAGTLTGGCLGDDYVWVLTTP